MKRFVDRLSVRRSMVLLMALVTLPMVGLIVYSVQKNHEHAIVQSSYVLSRFTATEASDFERTLNESRDVLKKLAGRPDIRALDPRHCPSILGEIKQLFPRYANVVVVNADGRIVCSVTPASNTASVTDQMWFAEAKRTNAFTISPPHVGPVTRKWVISLNEPVRDSDGRFAGLVGYSIDLGYRPLLHSAGPLPNGLALTVVDRHGTVVIQSENGIETPGKTFSDALALKIGGDARPLVGVLGNGPNERLVAVSPLGDTGLRIYGIRPKEYIAQENRRAAFRQLTIVTALAGLSIMLAAFMGRCFSLQLEKMARAVSRIAGGDLSSRIVVAGPSELADLARDFNHMLDVRLQAEARYQSLFEASSDGVVVADSSSRIILANSRAHQIFGYARGDLVQQDFGMLIPEFSRANPAQPAESAFSLPSNGCVVECYQGRRKNGELFKCEVNLTFPESQEGTIFSAVIRDLSEIERTSRRYLTAIDTTIDGYAVLGADSRFLESNSALATLTGYSIDELHRMTISDVDALCASDPAGTIQRRLTQHGNGRFETVWRVKSGELINVELSYSHHEEDGEVFCFIRDISARKKADLELSMSTARIRNLERAINEHAIVVMVDAAENITFVNDKYCAISQYSRDELLGKNYLDFNHALCSADFQEGPKQAMSSRRIWTGEIKNQTRDGAFYWANSTVFPFKDGNGKHIGYFIIQSDITRQKQVEEDLLQSTEQLRHLLARHREVKEEERKRIARKIHDNLGGLLHGIRSHLSVALKHDAVRPLSHDQLLVEAMEMADQAMESVRSIIVALRPSVLDQLGVWAAIESYASQIEERSHLRCQVMIDPFLEEGSLSDASRIAAFRIVQELMINVIRHADAFTIDVEATRMKDHVRIVVSDDGKGIDPAQIFGEQSWGIMGMYERARYCGGELRITRRSNRGTTAVLRLPLETSHVQ
ncbi:PAS domain S-box protein [Noviherbaspirillum sp.]|jgi:two-component system sensor histidine kinase UhpB|uniref:PAS domain S-box protein n=1 Tax=Noviherbaspirillum sp. TaxID=1926288 RepID=UPI0025DB97BE|nr:PAS domain S-box protein [Noviherbaspirillum sp.]